MSITLKDVHEFATNWFHAVASGATGDEQAKFFLHRDTRLFVGNGESFTLDAHHQLHQKWTDEKHILGTFELTTINDSPERVRAVGTVYWEAKPKDTSAQARIKYVVGENWVIEKTPDGLRFVLYISTTFQALPDSAPLVL